LSEDEFELLVLLDSLDVSEETPEPSVGGLDVSSVKVQLKMEK